MHKEIQQYGIDWDGPVSDDDLDIPLAHTHLLPEYDELDSLHRFIYRTINPFGHELNLTIDRSQDILPQAIRKYKHSRFDVSVTLDTVYMDYSL